VSERTGPQLSPMAALLVFTALCGVLFVVLVVAALVAIAPGTSVAGASLPPRRPTTVTIGWVGDVTPGSQYGAPAGDGRSLFAAVRPVLRRPDLMVANLEGTFGAGGAAKCVAGTPNCFAFQAPPTTARALRWAGIDVVNVANNHSFDYGPDGRHSTLAALRAAGVGATGLPGSFTVVRRRGIRVALVGFSTYPWAPRLTDPAEVRDLVGRAARAADVVVAILHAGAEGAAYARTPVGTEYAYGEDRGDVRAFARTAVDAGADLVLGSGPHVLRGLQRRHGRLIAYSLGNFAGVQNFSTAGTLALSGVLRVRLARRGSVEAARLIPVRLGPTGTPAPDRSGAALRFVDGLSTDDFGASAARVGPSGQIRLR
jgi:Bacterial capsule synthesis protein PGA_cap